MSLVQNCRTSVLCFPLPDPSPPPATPAHLLHVVGPLVLAQHPGGQVDGEEQHADAGAQDKHYGGRDLDAQVEHQQGEDDARRLEHVGVGVLQHPHHLRAWWGRRRALEVGWRQGCAALAGAPLFWSEWCRQALLRVQIVCAQLERTAVAANTTTQSASNWWQLGNAPPAP